MSLFRTNVTENFCKPAHVNNEYKVEVNRDSRKKENNQETK